MAGPGYIKIWRQLTSWEWYDDPNTLRVFLHLLLNASWAPNKWQGITLQPGQLVTGRKKLAAELKLSERKIRTSLTKLKSTSEIAIKTTSKYSIITICKWETYQPDEATKRPAKRPAERPTSDQQTTTTKEGKEYKEYKEGVPPPSPQRKKKMFTPPSFDEVKEYATTRNRTDLTKSFFDYYHEGDWQDKEGKPVKNWKQKFITWEIHNPKAEAQQKNQNQLDLTGRW